MNSKNENKVFEIAVGISLLFHLTVLGVLIEKPFASPRKKRTTYYVDLINFSPGGGGFKRDVSFKKSNKPKTRKQTKKVSMKELTTQKTKTIKKHELTYSKPVNKVKKKRIKNIKKAVQKKKIIKKSPLEEVYSKFEKEKSNGENKGVGFGVGTGDSSVPMIGSFPYAYYIEIVKNRISSNWITATLNFNVKNNYTVVVSFNILKSGGIKDLIIEKSSGINSLDTSALRAVKYSIPFPPLPRTYDKNELSVFIQFVLNKK